MTVRGRVLITGITGFAGSHLAELLVREGAEVHGIAHEDAPHPNLRAIEREVSLHRADLLDAEATASAVRVARPAVVFHLAAQAVPGLSWREPRRTLELNVLGTLDLLEALRATGGARLVLASSAEIYAPSDRPVAEDAPLGPENPYAASKLAQEALVGQYARAGAIEAIVLRPANQIGPRLHPELVASAFAKQVAAAEAGGERVIRVGALTSRRDFLDVRDAARAYVLAAERGEVGRTYNVGTGTPVAIRELLDLFLAESRVRIAVRDDPARRRPDERPVLSLDASAFGARTGWAPEIPLERSARDTLDYWRAALAETVHAGRGG